MRNVEAFREGRIKTRYSRYFTELRLNKRRTSKKKEKILKKKLNGEDTEARLASENISGNICT